MANHSGLNKRHLHPLNCKYCSLCFSDLDLYQKHTTGHKRRYRYSRRGFQSHHAKECVIPMISFETDKYAVDISVVSFEDPEGMKEDAVSTSDKQQDQKGGNGRFMCKYCNRTFLRRHQLWGHIRVHAEMGFKIRKVKSLQCKYCLKFFAYKCDLSRHESCHREECRFQCPHCHSLFNREMELENHIKSNSHRQRYSCRICRQRFVSNCKMQLHIQTTHDDNKFTAPVKVEGGLTCPVCLQQLQGNPLSLTKHLTKVHLYQHKCSICQKKFKTKYSLNDHARIIHKQYDLAAENSDEKEALDVINGGKIKRHPLQCPLCIKIVMTVTDLVSHLTEVHPTAKDSNYSNAQLKCEYCHKLFRKRKYIAEHMKRVHKVKYGAPGGRTSKHYKTTIEKDEQHKCSLCPAVYNTRKAVKDHKRRKHKTAHRTGSGKPTSKLNGHPTIKEDDHVTDEEFNIVVDEPKKQVFQCLRCPRSFVWEKDLKIHIQRNHSNIPKSPKRRSSRRIAKTVSYDVTQNHSAIKKSPKRQSPRRSTKPVSEGAATFKCGYCFLAFDDRRLLSLHMIRMHSNDEI